MEKQITIDCDVLQADDGRFVGLQGCAEHKSFSDRHLAAMPTLAKKGLKESFAKMLDCK